LNIASRTGRCVDGRNMKMHKSGYFKKPE